MTSLLDEALAYVAAGVHVFPCLPQSKAPHGLLVPHGVKEASNDTAVVRRWWIRTPDANIGLAIGRGLLFGVRVLDVDPKNGGDHELARLLARHGDMPVTPAQRSGSGGVHMLFRWPSGDYRTKVGPGVEILGPGRYIIAAPSVHPLTGGRYVWTAPVETPIAPVPAWLLSLARRVDSVAQGPAPRPRVAGPAYARGALLSAIARVERAPAGDRNNELNRQAFGLSRFVRSGELDQGLVRRALADAARAAGLPPVEAHQTISSALRARKAQA